MNKRELQERARTEVQEFHRHEIERAVESAITTEEGIELFRVCEAMLYSIDEVKLDSIAANSHYSLDLFFKARQKARGIIQTIKHRAKAKIAGENE